MKTLLHVFLAALLLVPPVPCYADEGEETPFDIVLVASWEPLFANGGLLVPEGVNITWTIHQGAGYSWEFTTLTMSDNQPVYDPLTGLFVLFHTVEYVETIHTEDLVGFKEQVNFQVECRWPQTIHQGPANHAGRTMYFVWGDSDLKTYSRPTVAAGEIEIDHMLELDIYGPY